MLEGFYLTVLIGPAVPVPAPRPVMEALLSAQVTVSAGQASGFQLTFALSKASLLNTALLPAGYFDPLTRVILMATVNGFPNVLIDGVITRHELAPSSEPGRSALTVTGEDLTRVMDLVELDGIPYPAMPAEVRVASIIGRYAIYGMVPLIIPSPVPDVPNPLEKIPGHKGTDLAYVKGLAEEVGYVFYVEPGPAPGMNVAYWGPEIKVGVPQSALSINMDAATNVESMTFSFDGMGKTQYLLMVQEPISKATIPLPLPSIGLLNPPLGLKQIPPLRVEKLETANDSVPQALARGLARAAQSADVISASGALDVLRYGQVLRACQLVGVRGAGVTYDGFYYVKSVTHNLKRGEYKQSFTLSRNALVPQTPAVIP